MSATSDESVISVHPNTANPEAVWESMKSSQTYSRLDEVLPLDTPVYDDKVRFVCISDTHNRLQHMIQSVPHGDVLLHAGDFTVGGKLSEVARFNDELGTLPHKHKLVIAGNHDLSFDETKWCDDDRKKLEEKHNVKHMRDILTNCTYLQDSMTVVYGIKVYGAPWQPEFDHWGFNLPRGKALLEKWNMIPNNIDILMTHGPPVGHGDVVRSGYHVGCVELLQTIQKRVKPKYHLFGHIHEDHGVTTDGVTTYINACIADIRYRPVQSPIIFDIKLPQGFSKPS